MIGLLPYLLTGSVMPADPNENMAVSLSLAALSFMVTVIVERLIRPTRWRRASAER